MSFRCWRERCCLSRGAGIGFTLAEVLITLGIIGIVASLTIPALIQSHKKHKVEARLAKFYSVMNQALLRDIEENGGITEIQIDESGDRALILKDWLEKHVTKYITSVKGRKEGYYYSVLFNDGTGFNALKGNNESPFYIFYCIDYSICEKKVNPFNGKDSFLFTIASDTINNRYKFEPVFMYYNHSAKINSCINGGYTCASLIMENGWKIPKDYPLKF